MNGDPPPRDWPAAPMPAADGSITWSGKARRSSAGCTMKPRVITRNTGNDRIWAHHFATTAPVPGKWAPYKLVAQLGYVMTAAEANHRRRPQRNGQTSCPSRLRSQAMEGRPFGFPRSGSWAAKKLFIPRQETRTCGAKLNHSETAS
jgi:hypothetical protein